ncbi:SpoIIE family protein phosphatase [Robertmurraya sp. P23]|uniref:SpoIIE family protein phosphatase n=1 Tax=Robertmurraya sp. P23 TaxID=3436931 RepID=UPI003D9602D5
MEHTYLSYNYPIVIVSVLVAIIASFITIELIERVVGSKQKREKKWVLASSFIWGSGIWTMHFMGILAIKSEVPFDYDVLITIFSLVITVTVIFFAFLFILYKEMTKLRLICASVIMGLGIASMHFFGMLGLNVHFDHSVVNMFLSIIITITASYLAMYIFSKVGSKRLYIYAFPIAALMGVAISGMHYSYLKPGTMYHIEKVSVLHTPFHFSVRSDFLLLAIIVMTVIIVGITYSVFRKENEDFLKLKLKELHLARKVQEKSLPLPIHNERVNITSFYKASEELSGDLYYWLKTDKDQYGIFIMDVMGHGVSSSIISMSIKSYLQGVLGRISEPINVMKELSNHMNSMFEGSENPFYFTAIYLLVDTKQKRIRYVNAGHPSGLWQVKGKPVVPIASTCPPIGLVADLPIISDEISFEGQGRLVLYTDGFMVGISDDPRVQLRVMEEILVSNQEKDIEEAKNQLLIEYKNHPRQPDDTCLLVIDINGE